MCNVVVGLLVEEPDPGEAAAGDLPGGGGAGQAGQVVRHLQPGPAASVAVHRLVNYLLPPTADPSCSIFT